MTAIAIGAVVERPRLWSGVAYLWAFVVAAGLSYFVYRIPVQLTDSLANLFQVQDTTWTDTVTAGIGGGYLRPALWMQIKAAFVLADGAYTQVFRGIHVAQILACAALFVGALRVRDRVDAAVVPFGLAVLFGSHTFDGTIREAFPINTYLTVVLACLAAVNLSFGARALWRDVAALGLVVLLLFTVESGVLVILCLAVGWLTGARGVSGRAVLAACAVLGGYLVLRFLVLDVGTQGLVERPSGFGLRTLESAELTARFGAWPYPFYAYNIASQMLTVLFSEPRTGVWAVVRDTLASRLSAGQVIAVATCAGATLLIGLHVLRSARGWRTWTVQSDDRLVLLFLAVLGVNAIVSFPYTKDVIVSPAGVFYALAATAAVRSLVRRLSAARVATMALASAFLFVLSAGWTIRLIGMHYDMRDAAFVTRNDWTEVDDWAERNSMDVHRADRALIVQRLREDALNARVPAPNYAEPALAPYFY